MATHADNAYEALTAAVGQVEGESPWMEIDQQRIDAFAEVSEDRQWIHVDPERAARESPYGTTIAHGFLTLSLLSHLAGSIAPDPRAVEGVLLGVNYGFEKVRFVSPVPVGSRIRARSVLAQVDRKDPNTLQLVRSMTVEVEGGSRPALVAEWVTRLVFS